MYLQAGPIAESSKSMPNAAWFLLRALDGISPFDIEFVFDVPGGSRSMLAASVCLRGKSEWLDQVLQGRFKDGNVIGWDYVDDYDRLENTPAGPSPAPLPGTRYIYIKDVAYKTYVQVYLLRSWLLMMIIIQLEVLPDLPVHGLWVLRSCLCTVHLPCR